MAQKTDVQLIAQAEVIRNEPDRGNTKARVATLFEDVIESKINNGKRDYKEYRARISQTGTGNPTAAFGYIDEISYAGTGNTDPLFKSISFSRTDVGDYAISITSNLANPTDASKFEISFSDGKIRQGAFSTVTASFQTSKFTFQSFEPDGTQADDVINFCSIFIRLYN